MKAISIEILNPKVQEVLQGLEKLGLIRMNPNKAMEHKSDADPLSFDPEEEVEKYGTTMEEIVSEVKEYHAEQYAKRKN